MKRSLSQIVADNLAKAMERDPDIDTQGKVAARSGGAFGQQHVGRILKGELSVGLEVLEGLAKAIKCEPWELLVDGDLARRAAWERILAAKGNETSDRTVVQMERRRKH